MSDIFGPILVRGQVEQAVIDLLKKWYDTYLREIELQIGWAGPAIPSPRSYTIRTRPEHYESDQLPQCVVVSPGLATPPVRTGNPDGPGYVYRATWNIAAGVVASAKDEDTTKALAGIYAAATRAIFIHHPSLEGQAMGLEWRDESYDDIPDQDINRTLVAGIVYAEIEFEGVVSWPGGPRYPVAPDPVNQPGSQWPTVGDENKIDIVLQKEAL